MTEKSVFDIVDTMGMFTMYKYYSKYLCEYLYNKYLNKCRKSNITGYAPKTFEEFSNKNGKNVIVHNAGDSWKENGFASKEWVSFTAPSIYHSVYHNLI
jgi:hypothetical protein